MTEQREHPRKDRIDDFMFDYLSPANALSLANGSTDIGLAKPVRKEILDLNSDQFHELLGRILLGIADHKWDCDKREGALMILNLFPKDKFLYNLPDRVKQYLQALRKQNKEHHPYTIAENLFDAGINLFSGSPLEERNRRSIVLELERVAGFFSSDKLTHDGLREKIEEFSQATVSISINTAEIPQGRSFAPNPYRLQPIRTIEPFPKPTRLQKVS